MILGVFDCVIHNILEPMNRAANFRFEKSLACEMRLDTVEDS